MIEQRCRLKAEGARWAAKRRRLLKESADYATEIEPRDQELIGKLGASINSVCFRLWEKPQWVIVLPRGRNAAPVLGRADL